MENKIEYWIANESLLSLHALFQRILSNTYKIFKSMKKCSRDAKIEKRFHLPSTQNDDDDSQK